jgi:hypothetical protein
LRRAASTSAGDPQVAREASGRALSFQQLAPPVTPVKAAWPSHLSRQVAVLAQLREQLPTQVTSHAEPALQDMLPLAPSVTAHLAFSPQSMLHDSPHVPSQVAPLPQASVQLPPHTCVEKSQDLPASQAQVVPVQTGGGLDAELPQPDSQGDNAMAALQTRNVVTANRSLRIMIQGTGSVLETGCRCARYSQCGCVRRDATACSCGRTVSSSSTHQSRWTAAAP